MPAAFFFAAIQAQASGLNVFPIRLAMNGPADIEQLTLANNGDRPLVVQVELFRWSQPDGEEQLVPTRDILATPAMVEILPQGQRTVRVGARHFPVQACESSYRVVLTEIPSREGPRAQVNFRTRMRLPLFVRARSNCQASVQWRRVGQLLVAENRGDAHIQYQGVELSQGDQRWALPLPQVGYVLPGSQLHFPLPDDLPSGPLQLNLTTLQGSRQILLNPAR